MEELGDVRWKTPIHLPNVDADSSQYINSYLTRKYNINTATREKSVMNVDDVYVVLYRHWIPDTRSSRTNDRGYR